MCEIGVANLVSYHENWHVAVVRKYRKFPSLICNTYIFKKYIAHFVFHIFMLIVKITDGIIREGV